MNDNQSRLYRSKANTIGSANFDPDQFLATWDAKNIPQNNDLRSAIVKAFRLKQTDDYVYHAIASVTLLQVQVAIDHGDLNGMHAWYRDENGQQIPPPSQADIEAYTQLFTPTTSTTKALAALAGNAKKGSLRSSIAQHLQSHLVLPSSNSGLALPGKQKSSLSNPSLDFWTWSCHCLEWAGPNAETVHVRQSHHVLPVFYHHFGCVVPTHDALSLIQQLSGKAKRPVVDVGSGNGYWTCQLRRMGLTVIAVDNALSAWRTTWIPDTIQADAVAFLKKPSSGVDISPGAENAILLLVYPQVSAGFTADVINAYKGDTIVVAGTQNGNGFTGFKDETIAEWMAREKGKEGWGLVCQVPLPSFAGKDEGLFVFVRRKGEVKE